MTNSLANHYIHPAQQSLVTPYSAVGNRAGGREGFWTTRFFSFLQHRRRAAALQLIGRYRYLANSPLRCLLVFQFACLDTVAVPVQSREPELH